MTWSIFEWFWQWRRSCSSGAWAGSCQKSVCEELSSHYCLDDNKSSVHSSCSCARPSHPYCVRKRGQTPSLSSWSTAASGLHTAVGAKVLRASTGWASEVTKLNRNDDWSKSLFWAMSKYTDHTLVARPLSPLNHPYSWNCWRVEWFPPLGWLFIDHERRQNWLAFQYKQCCYPFSVRYH